MRPANSGASRSNVRFQERHTVSAESQRVPSKSKISPSNSFHTPYHEKDHIRRDAAGDFVVLLYHIHRPDCKPSQTIFCRDFGFCGAPFGFPA